MDAGEATFSGNASSGILTVSDGTRTASIKLADDYRTTHFTASSDGQGGTIVVGSTDAASIPPHAFVAAMASLATPAGAAASISTSGLRTARRWQARDPNSPKHLARA